MKKQNRNKLGLKLELSKRMTWLYNFRTPYMNNKIKNKKYHTVGTVPKSRKKKYHTVGTVPKS